MNHPNAPFLVNEPTNQGSDTRYVPPKKTHPQKTQTFNLILVYTLYATNNAIFYCF